MKRAKIVCTIGPSSRDPEVLRDMIEAGMDIARLNFSHGGCKECSEVITSIRKAAKEAGKPVAIISDLKGVKIRLSEIVEGGIPIKENQELLFSPGTEKSSAERIYVSYPALLTDVQLNEKIYIDDGTIKLRVIDKTSDALVAKVLEGEYLKSNKGINLPQSDISMPTFTDKDKKDLADAMKCDIDYIATSFVRTASDVQEILDWAEEQGLGKPRIIAKIERPQAVKDIDAIIELVDGIMVARGDLGVESLPEEVPVFQKMLIEKANKRGKLVITATQMMESMVNNTRPTRAEASDVSNAVLDGSDALMLAAETAAGNYPVETVRMMNRIIIHTEAELPNKLKSQYQITGERTAEAMADGAVKVAHDIGAKAIVAFSNSGYLVELLAKYRPNIPILAITGNERVYRRLSLCWGTDVLHIKGELSLSQIETHCDEMDLAHKGDRIILVASSAFLGKRNTLRIHQM